MQYVALHIHTHNSYTYIIKIHYEKTKLITPVTPE